MKIIVLDGCLSINYNNKDTINNSTKVTKLDDRLFKKKKTSWVSFLNPSKKVPNILKSLFLISKDTRFLNKPNI